MCAKAQFPYIMAKRGNVRVESDCLINNNKYIKEDIKFKITRWILSQCDGKTAKLIFCN